MNPMMKNITVLCFMTDFLTQKRKLAASAIALFTCLPVPAIANTVDVSRYSTKGNLVTLRFRVLDGENVPIQGLTSQNFQIQTTNSQGKSINPATIKFNLLPPERQLQPDPIYVAILLDMSGSMRREDTANNQKLSGAVAAIAKFIDTAKQQNIPMQIALVPFGYRGQNNCTYLYEVDRETIANTSPFLYVNHPAIANQLQQLSAIPVCASTNLYQPLEAARNHLRNQYNQVVSKIDENPVKPRLTVILLSDGYDATNQDKFDHLESTLQQTPQVTVHTLGYGESLGQLRDRADCSEFIPNHQLTPQKVSRFCRLPTANIREYIIDEPRLKSIASATRGMYKLSGNADQVAQTLTNFLTTLREYEITYRQPDADRATRHRTKVGVISSFPQLKNINSQLIDIRIGNFIYSPLSLTERTRILGFTIIVALVGIFTFMLWSKRLKQQAERYL
jgi:von Willebrand factor type A domain